MQLELKHIKGGVLEQEYSLLPEQFPDLESLEKDNPVVFTGPINFYLRFQQTGKVVEVDGRLETRVLLNCGRCLGAVERTLIDTFVLTFAPQREEALIAERALKQEELGLIGYTDDRLELLAPLQEQLFMALPVRVLCSEQCRGLCPHCGADRNKDQCRCEGKPFNSKFDILAGLKH